MVSYLIGTCFVTAVFLKKNRRYVPEFLQSGAFPSCRFPLIIRAFGIK